MATRAFRAGSKTSLGDHPEQTLAAESRTMENRTRFPVLSLRVISLNYSRGVPWSRTELGQRGSDVNSELQTSIQ